MNSTLVKNNGNLSMRFDEKFVRGAVQGAVVLHDYFPEECIPTVDTRTLEAGQLFVAVKGERFDGHDFVAQAFKRGAAGCVIAHDRQDVLKSIDPAVLKKSLIITVSDTVQALVQWATAWRAQFSIPVIGVTGSVGKTSTKELIGKIFKENNQNCLVSSGNQNTRIGAALNLLRLRAHHDVAVFEMGINKRGQMKELAALVRPTTGIITCIGHSHMEGLGTLADIATEKRAIFSYFAEDSIGIINGDQALLNGVSYAHPVIKFGSKTINQVQARKIQVASDHIDFVLKLYKDKFRVTVPCNHEGYLFNILAAVAVTNLLGVPHDAIMRGISAPMTVPGRFERKALKKNGGTLINDCYNANPESMKAALLALEDIKTTSTKIAVLGDMLELGSNAPFWHRQIGRFIRKVPSLQKLILVGDMVQWTKKTLPVGLSVTLVPSWKDAVKQLEKELTQESLVLVKGSHGMALENLVHELAVE